MSARLQVSRDRLRSRIEALAQITEPDRPWTRRAFTDLFLQGRDWLAGEFRAAGLEPRLDAGANLVGERAGTEAGLGALMLGSHTDTVAGGGRFDGIAGVLTALEVAQVLHENGVQHRHPLMIVDFLSEEPSDYGASCVGSRAMVGTLNRRMLERTNPAGESLEQAIRRMGGNPAALTGPLLAEGDVRAYLELHIEQGPVLESLGKPIGVVGGIVGIQRLAITVNGRAGHAGTTPMDMRSDALVGASRLVELVWAEAQSQARELPFVATIGRFDVYPNGANVVPGRVELVLEARSMDDELTRNWLRRVAGEAEGIMRGLGLGLEVAEESSAAAVHCDAELRELLAQSCRLRGHAFHHLMSGAGHDAMQLARLAPVAMVFVPCDSGISHNPAENAHIDDLAAGTEVLLETVLALDAQTGEDR